MLLYNETVGVDKDIESDWLQWMRETHLPEILRTKKFVQYRMYKVLTHEDESSVSYAIQYFAENLTLVQEYLEVEAPRLHDEAQRRYGNKQLAYRTLLEEC